MLAEVRKCADNRDIKGLRYIFADSLDVDPTFDKYREDYEYCKSIDGMFDHHQELNGLVTDQSKWTMRYWEQLKIDLMKNFSKKRFEHMVNVAKVVYADKIARLMKERSAGEQAVAKTAKPSSLQTRPKQPAATVSTQTQRESQAAVKPAAAPAAGGAMTDARIQEERLDRRKRELKEEYLRKEKEQKEQRERIEAARREQMRQAGKEESERSKKLWGIVLAILVIIAAALLIRALSGRNPRQTKASYIPTRQECILCRIPIPHPLMESI